MHEPYTYLNGLQIKDLEDLVEDIKVYKELERGKNLDYWNDITVIVEDELQKLRKLQREQDFDAGIGRREGINQAVAQDVTAVFKGKTAVQLATLQSQIESKIRGKADGIDIGYWESLLSQLKAHIARARLRDRHQESLKRKLQVLKAEQAVTLPEATEEQSKQSTESEEEKLPEAQPGTSQLSAEDSPSDNEATEDAANDILNECFAAYQDGDYSPKLLSADQIEPGKASGIFFLAFFIFILVSFSNFFLDESVFLLCSLETLRSPHYLLHFPSKKPYFSNWVNNNKKVLW